MVKLRDQRLRFMFKQRYDYRANLIDWDYNMLLTQFAPIIHFYHYKQWRLTGLAFQQRFSTYTEPNRTLASYVPGRKKQERTSCLVRGYWGDMMVSPYIGMGAETNSQQKQLLFKKANTKYVGHSVQLTQYNLTYWLQRIETETIFKKYFQDYYRTDQEGKKKLQQKQQIKKKKKQLQQQKKKQLGQIKEEEQEKEKQDQKQVKEDTSEEKKQNQQIKQKEEKEKNREPKELKKEQNEELDSDEEERKAKIIKINAQDIKSVALKQGEVKLKLFEKYGVEFYPLAMTTQHLTKPKFKQFFDIIVCGFTHSAYLGKDRYIQSTLKKGGQLYIETARFIIPKKKQERKQLHEKLKLIANEKPSRQGQELCELKLLEDGQNHIIYSRTA